MTIGDLLVGGLLVTVIAFAIPVGPRYSETTEVLSTLNEQESEIGAIRIPQALKVRLRLQNNDIIVRDVDASSTISLINKTKRVGLGYHKTLTGYRVYDDLVRQEDVLQ